MDTVSIIVILISLVASAFFSGMETAFFTANRLKIELDNKKGVFSGKLLAGYVRNDNRFIAAMLLGNNIALVFYSMWMADLLEPYIFEWVGNYSALVLLIQTILSTLIILLLAEFLPKATFQINPNRVLRFLSLPLAVVYWILYPLTLFTITISNGILWLTGVKVAKEENVFSRVDFDYFVRDLNNRMKEEADLDNEVQILQNAIAFPELKARDCMIPRTDIIALSIDDEIEELHEKFIETGLSKILIYRDSIDNIIGYVHAFELFKKPAFIKEILIPISFVPEAIQAKELLTLFAKQNGNISVVVDEFGGTSGIITIEDVVEEIFGEIEDEHDVDDLLEQQIDSETFLFSARQDIDYINEKYELELEESTEYETLGGLILHHLASIPEEGTTLELDKYRLKIEAVSDRRIEVVRLIIISES